MKIYVGHSSGIDFREKLYRPLKERELADEHTLVFPHEDSDELFDSKSFLRDEADLFIAECSEPSTGLGIELGWADSFDVPVIAISRKGAEVSGSLKAVTSDFIEYNDVDELSGLILEFID